MFLLYYYVNYYIIYLHNLLFNVFVEVYPIRELNHKEGWVPKNWCFQIVVLEKTLESPLDSKEIKPSQS